MIVLDTHVLLWLDAASARLGNHARKAIDKAFHAGECAVSAISFWEVGMLARKGRVRISLDPEEWRTELLDQGLVELPVTGEIGIRAAALKNAGGDPADRLIMATARKHGARLVTADKAILKSSATLALVNAAR